MIKMIFSIIIIYMLYYVWIAFNFDKTGKEKKGKKKNTRKKNKTDKRKMPSEVKFFVERYNIDLDKINYRYFLQLIGLTVAFDLSFVIAVMDFISVLWIKCLVGFILMLVVVLLSFKLLGNYFKKKGLVKNDKNK